MLVFASYLEISFIALGVLALGGLLVYFFVSNSVDSRVVKEANKRNSVVRYTVRVDIAKQKIYIYSRSAGDKPQEYRFAEYLNTLDEENQKKLKSWMGEVIRENDDEEIQPLTLVVNNSLEPKTKKGKDIDTNTYYQVSLTTKNGDSIFLLASEIDLETHKRLEKAKSLDLLDWDDFVSRVSTYGKSARGAMLCVNCNIYAVVDRRYGNHVAEQLMHEIWRMVNSFNSESCIAAHYQDDSFLFYFHEITSPHLAERKAQTMLEDFKIDFSFDNYSFTPRPSVGIVYMGAYSTDVIEVVNEASKAADEAINHKDKNNIFTYSKEMADADHLVKAKVEEVRNIIEEQAFKPTYEPVFYLHGGEIVGYIANGEFKSSNINNFEEAYAVAESVDEAEEFYIPAVNALLDRFSRSHNKKSKRIFVPCDLKILEKLEDLVIKTPRYQHIDIVAVLSSYSELLEASDKVLDTINRSHQCKISLCLIADEDMQTSVIPALTHFSWLIIPNEMSDLVTTNQKIGLVIANIADMTERFNLNIMAWHITDYSQAEVLKTLGVDYMHGPILDTNLNYDGSSVRKIAKLTDEKE